MTLHVTNARLIEPEGGAQAPGGQSAEERPMSDARGGDQGRAGGHPCDPGVRDD